METILSILVATAGLASMAIAGVKSRTLSVAANTSGGSRLTDRLKSQPSRGMLVSLVIIGLVLLILTGFLVARTSSMLATPPQSAAEVTIENPRPMALTQTNQGTPVTGKVTGLPAGTLLWSLTRDKTQEQASTYQPSNQPCVTSEPDSDGVTTFNCGFIYIGAQQDTGHIFTIYIVLAEPGAVTAFLDYDRTKLPNKYPGLNVLPPGAKIGAAVEVVRS